MKRYMGTTTNITRTFVEMWNLVANTDDEMYFRVNGKIVKIENEIIEG